jgi:bifunctional DNA-binding transcriptional regulator/antitoxin component of YhaV-PrlF toxin-antitoxin module
MVILIQKFRNSEILKGRKMTKTIQMRKKGSVTIPMELRKRYRIGEGDPLTLIDLGEGFFLSPRQSVLPKLVAEIEALRQKNNISLQELIQGVAKERNK